MLTASLLLAAGFVSTPAHAWDHTGWVWNRDDMPLPWYMADSECSSIDFDELVPTFEKSFVNWPTYAPCSDLESAFREVREGHSGGWDRNDFKNTFSFRTEEQEPDFLTDGTLGVTICVFEERAFSSGGSTYYYAYDCDILFNDDYSWETTQNIEDGFCSASFSLEAVATHEIGHLWGMGHSCELDDVENGQCEDPKLLEATMFWTIDGTCSLEQGTLEDDDVEGIYALYGPYCSFDSVEGYDRYGGAPLEVCFAAECNSGISELVWNFGDGTSESGGESICHTYEDSGQYTVALTTTGGGDECGEFENTVRERAFVLVCSQPEPGGDFSGLFSYEQDEGLIYTMINQTDTTVYGCVDQILWEVFSGTGTDGEPLMSLGAWSPQIEFPSEGTYTIRLNVGGPGGLTADALTIDVVEAKGTCATVPAATGLFGILIGIGAAVRRRRRDD